MLFYSCLFIITVGLVLFTRKKVFTIMAFLLLSATYALRDILAVDDVVYANAFEYINLGWDYDIELSYKWLSQFFNQLGLNYKAIFFFYGTLSIYFFYKGINIFCNSNFQKAIFLSAFFGVVFITSMSVMRQFLASCIVFYAIAYFVSKKKLLPTILLISIASFFHYSASVAIVIFLLIISAKKIPDILKITLPIICLVLGYYNIIGIIIRYFSSLLPDSYRQYSNELTGSFSTAGGTMHIVLLLIFIAQFLFKKHQENYIKDEKIVFLEIGQMVYLCLNLLLAQAGVASRISITFIPFIVSLPYTFMRNFHLPERKFIGLASIMCMFAMLIITLNDITSNGSTFFVPYKWSLNFWGVK